MIKNNKILVVFKKIKGPFDKGFLVMLLLFCKNVCRQKNT